MRVLGLIPARGGSKGVKNKNIRPLLGKPLLQWTAESALASPSLQRVIISTDSELIAAEARKVGIEVPFMRPAELAQDTTASMPVVHHALDALAAAGDEPFDAVMLLQPTNPLRLASDIDGAVELLESSGAESVISFVDSGEKHPARMKRLDGQGRVIDPPFAEQFEGQRRQDLEPYFLREGSIYLTRTSVLTEQQSFQGNDCRAWVVPPERAFNIDTEFDLQLLEAWLQAQEA